MNLVKQYCSRVSDEDLAVLVDLLPQKVAFDRSSACAILQKDKEVDRWLSQAAGAEDWFIKVDGIGDQAILEMENLYWNGFYSRMSLFPSAKT
ncbi:hypothetical protein EBT16_10550, partial [bacterium]|nr:hypothetical protein [bacterium]